MVQLGRKGLVWGSRDRMVGIAGAEQDGTRSGDALRFGDVVLRAQKMPLGLTGSGGSGFSGNRAPVLQSSSDGPGLCVGTWVSELQCAGRWASKWTGREPRWPLFDRTKRVWRSNVRAGGGLESLVSRGGQPSNNNVGL